MISTDKDNDDSKLSAWFSFAQAISRDYVPKADLRKIVERMRNFAGCTEDTVDAGDAVDYWADEIEQILKREGE
jgi:hypothetical protein